MTPIGHSGSHHFLGKAQSGHCCCQRAGTVVWGGGGGRRQGELCGQRPLHASKGSSASHFPYLFHDTGQPGIPLLGHFVSSFSQWEGLELMFLRVCFLHCPSTSMTINPEGPVPVHCSNHHTFHAPTAPRWQLLPKFPVSICSVSSTCEPALHQTSEDLRVCSPANAPW